MVQQPKGRIMAVIAYIKYAALRPPGDWMRPLGLPRTTYLIWLRTIDDDLQSLNFGVYTALGKARDRDVWHRVVSTATLH